MSHLTTGFDVDGRFVPAVHDVSFEVAAGETLGLVGESGSGKSLTAFSILQLVPAPGRIAAGSVALEGRELLVLRESDMRKVRGAEISLIFQEPMTALNPVFTVGSQIAEALVVHGRCKRREGRQHAIALLDSVSVPNPEQRVDDYPHQLSGGLRQRVLIAIALACRPKLLIADEPTTALDVTIQAQILDLLQRQKMQLGLSLLLITHDLGVVAQTADRVAVMYAGRIVEHGPVRAILRAPQHPYTRGLIASLPAQSPGARLQAIEGTVPKLDALPPGCAFAPRCRERRPECSVAVPAMTSIGPMHDVRCFLHGTSAEPPVEPSTAASSKPATNPIAGGLTSRARGRR